MGQGSTVQKKECKSAPAFKPVEMQYCDDRNDAWSREVSLHCHGVHDLAAAEAQCHVQCYDEFRKIPVKVDQTLQIDDEAIKY